MRVYDDAFGAHGLVAGQVLLAPLDFGVRQQYLHARGTMRRLLELGVVPVVNENDAIADDEIRFGDNDRLAALVAHLVDADLLVLLTDTPRPAHRRPPARRRGLAHRGDRRGRPHLEAMAGAAPARAGSGGMASKIAAAKIAPGRACGRSSPAAGRHGVLADAVAGPDRRRDRRASRRMAACRPASSGSRSRSAHRGVVVVDDGARTALTTGGRSLLPAGVVKVAGRFEADDAVEVADPDGNAGFAKGMIAARCGCCRPWPAAGPPTSPTARPTRSSTATTSSSPVTVSEGACYLPHLVRRREARDLRALDGGRRARVRPGHRLAVRPGRDRRLGGGYGLLALRRVVPELDLHRGQPGAAPPRRGLRRPALRRLRGPVPRGTRRLAA